MSITEETRREAYESVQLPTMEERVLEALVTYGPQISEEIMDKLETSNPNNVRPRLTGLQRKGLARVVGKRTNRHGHNEAVWEAVPQEKKKAAPSGANTESGATGRMANQDTR